MKQHVWALAAMLLSTSCIPKEDYVAKEAEANACHEALRTENERKWKLSEAMADLRVKLGEMQVERNRAASEKGALSGALADLEKQVQDRINEVQQLSSEKSQLEAEKAALSAKNETYNELVDSLKREMEQKLIDVTQRGRGIVVNLSDQILFDSGKIDVKPAGQEALKKIAGVLKKVGDRRIDVEGHTDNVPIKGTLLQKYPSNWELSAARATNVVRFLQENGVAPNQMAGVGRSMFRPVAKNDTEEGRRLNRRTEIILTPWDVEAETPELTESTPEGEEVIN